MSSLLALHLSLLHGEHGVVEVAIVVVALAALPEDELEVVLEVVQHQTLSVLDAVCVEKKALHCIKALFIKEPIRAYPDFSPNSGKFILETDFSATARSAVLLQEDPKGGPNKFLGCCAAKNDAAAANYSSNKGELAAVILGLKKYEHILSWKPFTIVTDNACVSFLRNLKTQKGIYSRWKEILASYDFDIVH